MLGHQQTLQKKVSKTVIKEGNLLDDDQKQRLCRIFSADDVKHALYNIEETKAPGPDGYTSGFFKEAWGRIGAEVTTTILDLFQSGKLLKQVNSTSLCLVPKCEQPEGVTQFRPISC